MNAYVADFSAYSAIETSRVERFIFDTHFDRPTLVIDREAVARQFRALRDGLGRASIHYAVKANPAREIIETLVGLGSHFDAASRGEIELCLAQGAAPSEISFGNTIKRASDIAWAHGVGITLFAADAEEELEKIAEHAPGARVYIRLIVDACEADWPLTRKFGCGRDKAVSLIARAAELGLDPVGLSFHVGSQTKRAAAWAPILDQVKSVWDAAEDAGFPLSLLNIGGGFPAFYTDAVQGPTPYAAEVMAQVEARFGTEIEIMAEPGRGMVAEAGAIAAEVVLVSKKSDSDLHRWVYLDIGRFSGLAETEGEAIRYQFATQREHEAKGPCVMAGPSCDSADVLYEKRPVELPLGLRAGDKVAIRSCGAYTSTYSSVGFNGFPPLDVVVI
ncbi:MULTISPECIES: type III PLP-dependent enzyme [unclassified Roseivivax]|uniref:type III PLP-dependent enzyme n=1 Tax=Roseivivax sp. GX 12232 TaxID=2900547 RepID=UPI001E33142E|nr:type III PLP-dependent enzyme [Roseivivax sp. GX 12232]MCE0505568.1 type III PLP-dependent enzyme [Roseivivax sp. GX 12232]